MDTENEMKDIPVDKEGNTSHKQLNMNTMWVILIVMYVFLFTAIVYIAFWEQDFNDPDKFLVKYETLREKHFQVIKSVYDDLDNINEDEEFNTFINNYMNAANDSAGDLQELATQSFNIVLGAFLAFLSATTTMVFQGKGKSSSKPNP